MRRTIKRCEFYQILVSTDGCAVKDRFPGVLLLPIETSESNKISQNVKDEMYMHTCKYVSLPADNPRWCVRENTRGKGDRIVRELKIMQLNIEDYYKHTFEAKRNNIVVKIKEWKKREFPYRTNS